MTPQSAPGEAQAFQTPLIDLLRDVPADARIVYEHSPTEHSFIPAGRLCSEAAARIAELEAEVRRRYSEDEIAAACAALEIWDAKYESLLITLQEKRDAAHQETPNA